MTSIHRVHEGCSGHFPATWHTTPPVCWQHARSLQRTTRRHSCDCLSAWQLYHWHLCLVWCEAFAALWFSSASQLRQLSSETSTIHVNQWPLYETWYCGSTPSCRCPRTSHAWCRRASIIWQLGHVTERLIMALVLSHLDYCNAVLGGLPASTLAPFQQVLYVVACTVLDLKPCNHVTPALQQLHWLPVIERIQFKLCLLVHKWLLRHSPEYILDLLTSVADMPAWSARWPRQLATSSSRRHVDESATALRAWNSLPAELKLLRSTTSFRHQLKTSLFQSAYGHWDMDWWLLCDALQVGLQVGGAIQIPELQFQFSTVLPALSPYL